MRPDTRAYLWDIKIGAEAIDRFTSGMDTESYARSELVSSAVERKFEIIGEALGQLAKLEPGIADRIPDLRAIIAFRNLLIHGYAVVEHDRVFRIARTSLPGLRTVIEVLLAEIGPERVG